VELLKAILFSDNFSVQMAVSVCPTMPTGLGWSAACSTAIPYWGGLEIFWSLWSSIRCELCGPWYKQHHSVSISISDLCFAELLVCIHGV